MRERDGSFELKGRLPGLISLCNLCVLCVSVVVFTNNFLTTELSMRGGAPPNMKS
jgi:hypothetical protein